MAPKNWKVHEERVIVDADAKGDVEAPASLIEAVRDVVRVAIGALLSVRDVNDEQTRHSIIDSYLANAPADLVEEARDSDLASIAARFDARSGRSFTKQ